MHLYSIYLYICNKIIGYHTSSTKFILIQCFNSYQNRYNNLELFETRCIVSLHVYNLSDGLIYTRGCNVSLLLVNHLIISNVSWLILITLNNIETNLNVDITKKQSMRFNTSAVQVYLIRNYRNSTFYLSDKDKLGIKAISEI